MYAPCFPDHVAASRVDAGRDIRHTVVGTYVAYDDLLCALQQVSPHSVKLGLDMQRSILVMNSATCKTKIEGRKHGNLYHEPARRFDKTHLTRPRGAGQLLC